MKAAVIGLVVLGIALSVALAAAAELDTSGVVILATVVLTGALAIATARRTSSGSVEPVPCAECGGLLSPNSPFCKHCGARR